MALIFAHLNPHTPVLRVTVLCYDSQAHVRVIKGRRHDGGQVLRFTTTSFKSHHSHPVRCIVGHAERIAVVPPSRSPFSLCPPFSELLMSRRRQERTRQRMRTVPKVSCPLQLVPTVSSGPCLPAEAGTQPGARGPPRAEPCCRASALHAGADVFLPQEHTVTELA